MMTHASIVRLGGIGLAALVWAAGWVPVAWAQQSKHKTYFVGTDGVPVLTNRPHAYRNNADYEEVKINFEPVIVTGNFVFSPGSGELSSGDLASLVRYWSGIYNLDPNMVFAVIRAESNFNPYAVSKAGARGLMQIMPATGAEMRIRDLFDPEQNVAGGTQYLAKMMELFDDNVELSLAAYNAGPGAVKKHGGIPPFKETRDYVRKVTAYTREYARGGGDFRLASSAAPRPEDYLPEQMGRFTIRYKSGATQPADKIEEQELFYVAEYEGRKYLVRKKFVEKIVKEN